VVFEAVLSETLARSSGTRLGGVRVVGLRDDPSELPRLYSPGHPDADAAGYITMPNVQLPIEMVNLVTASRAYEANLRVLQSFRQMVEQSLSLARG
jgi:flagellar basal-body rod protein FlgC